MAEPYVVVVSRETPDGGKPGVKTEVPRGSGGQADRGGSGGVGQPEEAAQFRAERERRRAEMAGGGGAVEPGAEGGAESANVKARGNRSCS